MTDTIMKDPPTLTRLLDHGPIADAIALHLTSGLRLRDPASRVLSRGFAKPWPGVQLPDHHLSYAWSFARTCHRAYASIVLYLYRRLDLQEYDILLLINMSEAAKRSIIELAIGPGKIPPPVTDINEYFQVQDPRFNMIEQALFGLPSVSPIGLPNVKRFSARSIPMSIFAPLAGACPHLRDLQYYSDLSKLSISLSTPLFEATAKFTKAAMAGVRLGRHELDIMLDILQGAEYMLVVAEGAERRFMWEFNDLLEALSKTAYPPRKALVLHLPSSSFRPSSTSKSLRWPTDQETEGIVIVQPMISSVRKVHEVTTFIKPKEDGGPVELQTRIYPHLKGEFGTDDGWKRSAGRSRSPAEAWQMLLDIQSRDSFVED